MHHDFQPEDSLTFFLYPPGAQSGEKPALKVEVMSDPLIARVQQGRSIDVHGTPKVGHAIVVAIDGTTNWPVYPATAPGRSPRL